MNEQVVLRKFLSQEFKKIQNRNPRYSLRKFADKIGISPSALSLILAGKRRASRKLVSIVCEKLELDHEGRAALLGRFFDRDLNVADLSSSDPDPAARSYYLDSETFSVIADWQYFAVLSLIKTSDFQNSSDWIASRLGISPAKATEVLANLKKLNLVNESQDGKLIRTQERLRTQDDDSLNLARRKSHLQTLDLARASVTEVSSDLRDFSSFTIATHPDRLPEAKALIRKFEEALDHLLYSAPIKSEVYRCAVALFPITKVQVETKKGKHEIQN